MQVTGGLRALSLSLALAFVGACGSSGGSNPATSAAEKAHCGQPGDVGNALGVGKYCMALADCAGAAQAMICSTLGGPGTNFCTMPCTAGDAGNTCGTGATCQCSGQQCGCLPDYCH